MTAGASPTPSAASARARLAEFAATPGAASRAFPTLAALPLPPDRRAAAVLILFGVLDDLPSERPARAATVSPDLDVLLLARASTLRAHAGEVAFPGGRADPDDADAVATALREAVEETGLDASGVEVLGVLDRIPLAFSRHVVAPVLAWWERPSPVGVVDAAESADVFRVPVADLLDPAHRGTTVLRRDGREWRGPGFLVRGSRLDATPNPGPVPNRDAGSGGPGFLVRGSRLDATPNPGPVPNRDAGSGGPGFLVQGPDSDAAPHPGAAPRYLVWGFTAMVLDGLFTALGWTEPWDRTRELPRSPPPAA